MISPFSNIKFVKYLSIVVSVFFFIISPTLAMSDEYTDFLSAKNAFDAGEYEQTIKRFTNLLDAGLKNHALILESHKLIAISCLFVEKKEQAETHFMELLTKAPNYQLDPLLYPIEVVDFFTKIKGKNKERLEELAKAQEEEAKQRKLQEEARQKEELEKLKRNIYLEHTTKKGSLLVALMPFGAGQFQNKEIVKGSLFLTSEVILTGASIASYFLHQSLRKQEKIPFDNVADRKSYEQKEKIYRITNQVCVATLGVVIIIGIIDSVVRYKPKITSWQKIKEKDVPKDLRPVIKKTSLSLKTSDESLVLGISGQF